MKNANMPAHPQAATSEGYGCNYTENFNGQIPTGLTKREMFAMHAMQSLIISLHDGAMKNEWSYPDEKCIAEQATDYADALLAELEKSDAGI